jgi:hypothetical protein
MTSKASPTLPPWSVAIPGVAIAVLAVSVATIAVSASRMISLVGSPSVSGRATVLQGAAHLALFVVFLFLAVVP